MLPIAAMSESSQSKGMPWFKTGATHYQAQLGLLDKGRAIKELVVYWVLPGRMSVLNYTLHAVYVQSGVEPNCNQSDTALQEVIKHNKTPSPPPPRPKILLYLYFHLSM